MPPRVRTRVSTSQRVSTGRERSANKHDHQESNEDGHYNVGNREGLDGLMRRMHATLDEMPKGSA